jgi:RNA polymerase-binding transcription factor DksA
MATKTGKKPAKSVAAKPAKGAKPAAKSVKPAVKAPAKPVTTKVVAKPSAKTPSRPELKAAGGKHDKPGTGRVTRAPERRSEPAPKGVERRIAEPAPLTAISGSPFTADELREWRRTLLEHRSEISQDIQHLEQDAMEAEDGHTTPNHIAERGSDAEMQDISLGLAGEEQSVLWQIDRALRKIDSGVPLPFGLCEHSKQPIPKTRLQLIPWTPVSIEGMNYVEENGLVLEDVLVDG